MAEPQTDTPNPAGADIGALISSATPPGLRDKLTDIRRDQSAATDKITSDLDRSIDYDQAETHRWREASEASGIEAAKYPKWDADQEREKFRHDPIEAFGSLGSVVGLLASAFVHAPMESAFNASAAAMNAIKAGDDQAYDRAHTAWKENMELVYKRHDLMRNEYQDATSLMKTDMAAGEAKLKSAAARFGDKRALALSEAGMDKQLYEYLDAQNKTVDGLRKINLDGIEYDIKGKLLQQAAETAKGIQDPGQRAQYMQMKLEQVLKPGNDPAKQGAVTALLDKYAQKGTIPPVEEWTKLARDVSPYGHGLAGNASLTENRVITQQANEFAERYKKDHPDATPDEVNAARNAEHRRLAESNAVLTAGQQKKETEKTQRLESVRNQIKEAIRLIDEGDASGNSVTGIKGAVGTVKEFFVGDASEHARFVALVNSIQKEVNPLLTGSTRQALNKEERSRLDTIVAGLGFMRNSKQARDTLEQLDKIISHVDLAPGAAEAIALPERYANEPDGTEIPRKSDGSIWIKRGNKLVPK